MAAGEVGRIPGWPLIRARALIRGNKVHQQLEVQPFLAESLVFFHYRDCAQKISCHSYLFQILILFFILGGVFLKLRESIPENPFADVTEVKQWILIGAGLNKANDMFFDQPN